MSSIKNIVKSSDIPGVTKDLADKSLETEKAKLIEIYKIQTDTNGNVLDIRVKLTKDQKKDKIQSDQYFLHVGGNVENAESYEV